MKHLLLLGALAATTLIAVAAPKTAAPAPKAPAKVAPKPALKTLSYCPISGEKLPAKKQGATTYKGYNIAFCCPGCPEEFKALSPKEKDAKIAAIVAKQAKAEAKPAGKKA